MLQARNGFYAFESALHVFHVGHSSAEKSMDDWNAQSLWRGDYGGVADGCLFFAEDVFGFQFCVFEGAVHILDPETGKKKPLARDLEGWAQALLHDYRVLTGQPLAHEWQEANGPIPPGKRLNPYPPFALGGEYKMEALRAIDAAEMMRLRADIAKQIAGLPDGSKVKIRIK